MPYKNLKQAIDDLTQAIELATDNNDKAKAHYNRGNAYIKQEDYEKAVADFTQAIELATDNNIKAKAYYNRGNIYAKQEDYEKAVEDFDKVTELNPNHELKYLQQGIDSLNEKGYRTAIDNLNIALRHGIPSEIGKTYKKERFKENNIGKNIFTIFVNVSTILDELKVSKDSKDSIEYLSHTTKLSVFTKFLVPVRSNGEPELGKLRMYHIAYANDPTEGTVLLKHLGIAPEQIKASANIRYVMVASFCGGQDIKALDRLPMWSMYGDNAKGIALLFQTKDLAYSEQGHIGYIEQAPAIPYLSSFESNKLGDDNKQDKTIIMPQENTKSTEKEIPPQILYKVHYVQKSENTRIDDEKSIDKMIENIEKRLANITKDPKYNLDIYHKCLELLNGIRYLIKDKSYAYEQEYRLVCFAGTEHIPKILKSEEQKDIPTKSVPYIYVETDKLDKLCAVITAPKASKAEQLYIDYLLQLYKKSNQFSYMEEPAIHKSSIPYR